MKYILFILLPTLVYANPYALIDINGKYGMTQNSFAIKIENEKTATNIKNAITSNKFKEIIKSTKWGNFQVDYKMFESFRVDFWKEFIK